MEVVDVLTTMEIITSMAASGRAKQQPRSQPIKPKGVLELSTTDAILAQNKRMTQQIELLNKTITQLVSKPQLVQVVAQPSQPQVVTCELCGDKHPYSQGPHANFQKEEELNYVNNQKRGNFFSRAFKSKFSNNYIQGWKNPQGQNQNTWKNKASSSSRPPFIPLVEKTSKMKDTLENII
jgi:hypothetical protein